MELSISSILLPSTLTMLSFEMLSSTDKLTDTQKKCLAIFSIFLISVSSPYIERKLLREDALTKKAAFSISLCTALTFGNLLVPPSSPPPISPAFRMPQISPLMGPKKPQKL